MLLGLWIFGVICFIIASVFSAKYERNFVMEGFDGRTVDKEKLEKWKQSKKGKRESFLWNLSKCFGIIFGVGITIIVILYKAFWSLKETFIETLRSSYVMDMIETNFLLNGVLVMLFFFLFFIIPLCDKVIYKKIRNLKKIVATIYGIFVIISMLILPFVASKLYNDTSDNIIVTEQNGIVISEEERKITIFCEIPTQNIYGHVNGRLVHGSGKIEGMTATDDLLPYWYLPNGNYPAEYDTAPAEHSKLFPMTEGETPYVKITTYQNIKITDNQNPWGEKEEDVTLEWTDYEFFLPEYIVGGM